MHRTLTAALTGLVAATVIGSAGADAPATAEARTAQGRLATRTHPAPSRFTPGRVDNEWFPLKPGTRWVYRGTDSGRRITDVMIARYRTTLIDGVTCRVVLDRVLTHGHLLERTRDYYAQTRRGTVWYFGEDSAEYDGHGHVVSREDSWRSGRDGAEAGIFMTPHPHPGPVYEQEDYPGHAEDRYTVLRVGVRATSPLLDSRHALETLERSPLEPGVREHKFYVRGIGDVHDVIVRGGTDHQALVSLTHLPRR
jgi:hypothetical protein